MHNFKDENLKRHVELFNIAEELELLADEMRHAFNCQSQIHDFRRSKMSSFKTIFLPIINNVMQQFNSVRILCLEGYGQSALIISRSTLENLISVKYMISANSTVNQKAERFEAYKWVEMKNYLKYWKMDDEVIDKERAKDILSKEEKVLANYEDFKKKFDVKDNQLFSWSGVSIAKMAEEVGMLGDYRVFYSMCCSYSHPSFLGIQQGVHQTKEVAMHSSTPSFLNVVVSLKSIIEYFYAFLFIYDFLFKLGMKQKLENYVKKAKIIFEMDKYI